MSYSDKHRSTADCKVRDCDSTGTNLEIRAGQLNWYCDTHRTQDPPAGHREDGFS